MIRKLRITVVSENTAGARGLLAEHGLACWVEADGQNILFDTGQGLVLAHNAKELAIDLSLAQAVVLTHGHYDHTGGLPAALQYLRRAVVYVHPAAFQPKFGRREGGPVQAIGSPTPSVDAIRRQIADVVFTHGPTQVAAGIWVTGRSRAGPTSRAPGDHSISMSPARPPTHSSMIRPCTSRQRAGSSFCWAALTPVWSTRWITSPN